MIRPLIECAESRIEAYAKTRAFPILPCNLCGSQSGLQRDQMTALISKLEESIPNVREVMLASIKNVRTTHLLDPALLTGERKAEPEPPSLSDVSELLQIEEPEAEL